MRELNPFGLERHTKHLPHGLRVYFLFDGEEIVYIGQTRNIYIRMGGHVHNRKLFDSFAYIEIPEEEFNITELRLIAKYKPKYNKSELIRLVHPNSHKKLKA